MLKLSASLPWFLKTVYAFNDAHQIRFTYYFLDLIHTVSSLFTFFFRFVFVCSGSIFLHWSRATHIRFLWTGHFLFVYIRKMLFLLFWFSPNSLEHIGEAWARLTVVALIIIQPIKIQSAYDIWIRDISRRLFSFSPIPIKLLILAKLVFVTRRHIFFNLATKCCWNRHK